MQSARFDILDRTTNSVDADGVTITNTYDSLNRLLTRGYPDGGVEHFGYSPGTAAQTSYTNQLNFPTLFGYDAAGRKIAETNSADEVPSNGRCPVAISWSKTPSEKISVR